MNPATGSSASSSSSSNNSSNSGKTGSSSGGSSSSSIASGSINPNISTSFLSSNLDLSHPVPYLLLYGQSK